ncbi:hypothetical protein IJJ08_05055 [bacterium]|nr:hypothetical protein [bacterium]
MTKLALRQELLALTNNLTTEQLKLVVKFVYRVQEKTATTTVKHSSAYQDLVKMIEARPKSDFHWSDDYKQELNMALEEKYAQNFT